MNLIEALPGENIIELIHRVQDGLICNDSATITYNGAEVEIHKDSRFEDLLTIWKANSVIEMLEEELDYLKVKYQS